MANITNITMNVAAGEIYKIEIPVVPKMGLGYEPKSGSVLDISGNKQKNINFTEWVLCRN